MEEWSSLLLFGRRVRSEIKWNVKNKHREGCNRRWNWNTNQNKQSNIWKIHDGGCWHVRFIAFVTILLNRPYRSRRFIYFKASFSCKKHKCKIYKTQRVLVANLATNFWILVTSTIILVALATVLGAISCPVVSYLETAEKIKRLAVEHHAYTDHENNIQRVSESQLRDALDTGWIIVIRCIILIWIE